MYKICAFSGHRNLKDEKLDYELLDRVVLDLVKRGTTTFLCGMALGFDTVAAECVIKLKEKFNIELVACLPCSDQSIRFSEKNKQKYSCILSLCDKVITLNESYHLGCMHERDRYMVDNSDVLVCFLRREKGGTFYTVNYARKSGKPIIEL